jgi:TorA maturation chaperone TorD
MFHAQLIAAGVDEEERRRFAAQHLSWIPNFCQKIARETKHEFYLGLADFTSKLARSAL